MPFESAPQQLVVDDPSVMPHMGGGNMSLVPLEVSEHPHLHDEGPMEVKEPGEVSIVIEDLGAVPGAENAGPLEVVEQPEPQHEEAKVDDNEAKKSKKDPKWDWESRGAHGFIAWVKERCDDVPKHSGMDTAGLERAASYLEKLDNEISRAMRMDLDGELDANQIEKVRAMIDDGVARLHDRLDKVKKHKKNSRKKKTTTADYQVTKYSSKKLKRLPASKALL